RVLVLNTVSVSSPGKIDLFDNDAVIRTTPRATVEALVKSGRGSGSWNGTGITSSTAGASSINALGVIQASDAGYTTFSGETVNGTDTLVKYTYVGDANLDGKVT